VLRQENEEYNDPTRPVVDVEQLEPADLSNPSLKRADVEDRRVGDG